MDIISIPKTNETYRVLLDNKRRLTLKPILNDETDVKLSKIVNKTTIKGGQTQLNLHDGRNLLTEEDYKVGDVLSLKMPEQEVQKAYKFEEGATVLVTGGKHTGEIGKVSEIIINQSSNPNTVIIENSKKENFRTLKDYAFVIGENEPSIELLEVNK